MKNLVLALGAVSLLTSLACSRTEVRDPVIDPNTGNQVTPPTTTTTQRTGQTALPTPPPVLSPGSPDISTRYPRGGTALLEVDSVAIFEKYTQRPMNRPYNVILNMDVREVGRPTGMPVYGGKIRIAYNDTDVSGTAYQMEGTFSSGESLSDLRANPLQNNNSEYINRWFFPSSNPSKEHFQGFFEDAEGGIMVVIDSKDDQGLASGSVYFLNFDFNVCTTRPPFYCAPKGNFHCWQASLGPYDCREMLTYGNGAPSYGWITLGSRIYPGYPDTRSTRQDGRQYERLGRFDGLDVKKAFNIR